MNLKDLSQVVIDSMDECIRRRISPEDVNLYFISLDNGVPVNYVKLMFSEEKTGIIIFDNVD